MKKLIMIASGLLLALSLTACASNASETSPLSEADVSEEIISTVTDESPTETVGAEQENQAEVNESMQILIETDDGRIVFQLNNSPAAKEFYNQLPLSIWIDDYNNSEKTFYPPEELDTSNTPMAEGPSGTLAYYEP